MNPTRHNNYLKRYRKQRGLSQKEVAKILGLKSTGMISRWEHGVLLPETINALKMSVIYQASVDDIYEDLHLNLEYELSPRVEAVLHGDRGAR